MVITRYKRIFRYVNMCWSVHDYKIKFIFQNQGLVLKEQDSEHIQEHLQLMRSWRFGSAFEGQKHMKDWRLWRYPDSKGHASIRRLWLVLSSSKWRSLLDSDGTVCLLLTTCPNTQRTSRIIGMKQIILVEAKEIQIIFLSTLTILRNILTSLIKTLKDSNLCANTLQRLLDFLP